MSMQNGFGYRMLALNAAPKKFELTRSNVPGTVILAATFFVQYRLAQEFSQYCTPVSAAPLSNPTMQSTSPSPSKSAQNGAAYPCDVLIIVTGLPMLAAAKLPSSPRFFA
jgi:hypothetical protein